MIYKRYALFCFLLFAIGCKKTPIANERTFSPTPSIMTQGIDTKEAEANELVEQGNKQYQISQFREALQSWEKALQIYREIKNRKGEANALGNLGLAYQSLGQYQEAIKYHQQSLDIKKEIGDHSLKANSLGGLGLAYFSLGEYQKAIEYHQQSLAIAKEIGNRQMEAASLGNLGIVYQFLGQYQKAIEYHQQSLAIAKEIDDPFIKAKSLGNLGLAYQSLGQYQKAIEYFQQTLAIAKEINDPSGQANSLGNLGLSYFSLGQYQKAIEYHQQHLSLAKKIGDRAGEASSLGNLGNTYHLLGQHQKAINYYQQSLAIVKEINYSFGIAASLDNLGIAYQSLGQYQKAIKYHQQSFAIKKEIRDRFGEAKSLGNLGNVYDSLRQYQKAISYHQQSLAIVREIGDLEGEAQSLGNLGIFYRKTNQPSEAIKNLEASLKIYLDIRGGLSRDNRKQFLATNQRTVITLAEVLIQQNQPEKAFQWLNLATTADLADYNRLINAQVANPEIQKAIDNWKTNNQQLEAMRQQLQTKFSDESARQMREFEAKVNQEAETIAQKYPEVAELFETKPTDIAQLRQNIAPDTLVIQPVLLRDKIALFLLTKNKLTVIESNTKADEFNQLVNTYRNQISDRKNADYLDTSSKFYDILIRPIEQQIKINSPKNLAIIATDQLRYIPFESLYDSKTEQYLLQKYPISYLTRISTANIPNSPSKTAKNLQALALANPKPTNEIPNRSKLRGI